jgi:2-oxoglutarate ferredoxin oxidoreductase subunit alpha
MKGNEALAETAIRVGCKCYFGYPITPQTEISAYMSKRMPNIDGGVFIQAESEIAAINMVLGASASGVRAMTSSSSPGISLKSEGVSYMAGCDLPGVVVNVQRGGPGLGGIQPSQSDYWQATKALGHGDFQILVFAPASVQEIIDLTVKAFDTSDYYRIPAMILMDGLLGQMMEPVTFPELTQTHFDKSWACNGHQNQRQHNIINSLFLQADILEDIVVNRYKRYEIVKQELHMAESYLTEDADIVVVAYGATARIVKSAVLKARSKGVKVGMFRPITLWPFPTQEINQAVKGCKDVLCVEMSMGQMVDDVKLAIECSKPVHFYGRTGGVVPTPNEVLNKILELGGVS